MGNLLVVSIVESDVPGGVIDRLSIAVWVFLKVSVIGFKLVLWRFHSVFDGDDIPDPRSASKRVATWEFHIATSVNLGRVG